MRVILIGLALLTVMFAGCIEVPEDEQTDFERTCPVYYTATGLNPKWRNEGLIYDADSESPDALQKEQRDKWIVHPTIQGGFNYGGGELAWVDFDIDMDIVVDAYVFFEVYQASAGERQSTPPGEEVMSPTGPRMMWQDLAGGYEAPLFSQITYGPTAGHDEEDIIQWQNGTYRVAFPRGIDPSRLRVDVFFEGDQDGDPTTDSGAAFTATASFWWLHEDCL